MARNNNPITHKQSKFLTIMIVPYSSKRMTSIKIPHWIFHFILCIFLVTISFGLVSYTRSMYFEYMAANINVDLQKTMEINSMLEEENKAANQILQEKAWQYEARTRMFESNLDEQRAVYDRRIQYYEEKSRELVERLNELFQGMDEINTELQRRSANAPVIGNMSTLSIADGMDIAQMHAIIEQEIENIARESTTLLSAAREVRRTEDRTPSIWPLRGRLTSGIGYRANPFGGSGGEFHTGIDISAPVGTPVRAAATGTVTFAGFQGAYGNIVKINHGNGYETYYAHNSRLLVAAGDTVTKGQVIAHSGNTGRSTGPHLHFEVRFRGEVRNPLNYIQE